MAKQPRQITLYMVGAVAITTIGSSMNFGYSMAVLNSLKLSLETHLFEPNKINGTVATALYSGLTSSYIVLGTIGAFSSGICSDYFGRKKSLMLNNLIAVIGGLIPLFMYMMPHVALLFISRFILGLNAGLTSGIAPMFLAEISPTIIRGGVTAFHQLLITFGILLSYIFTLDTLFNTPTFWISTLAFPIIPASISFVLLNFLPESPRYLYINVDQPEEALAAMKCYNEVDDPHEQLEELKKEDEVKRLEKKFRVLDLFKGKMYRKAIYLTILLNVMQQFSGINAVIGYSGIMFEQTGIPKNLIQYCVMGIGLLNFLSTLPAIFLLEKLGRKTLLVISSTIAAVSLLACFITIGIIPMSTGKGDIVTKVSSVIFISTFIVGFSIGLGPIPGIATAEIFTQAPRAAAYSIGLGIQWSSSFVILFLYPIVNSKLPSGFVFLIFLAIIVPGLVYVILFMPETKNRSFKDIANDLGGVPVTVENEPEN